MKTAEIGEIGKAGAKAAMRAAAAYMQKHLNGIGDADVDLVVLRLKDRTDDAVERALADAREAMDAGMEDAASATFLATMALAGIEAARDVELARAVAS